MNENNNMNGNQPKKKNTALIAILITLGSIMLLFSIMIIAAIIFAITSPTPVTNDNTTTVAIESSVEETIEVKEPVIETTEPVEEVMVETTEPIVVESTVEAPIEETVVYAPEVNPEDLYSYSLENYIMDMGNYSKEEMYERIAWTYYAKDVDITYITYHTPTEFYDFARNSDNIGAVVNMTGLVSIHGGDVISVMVDGEDVIDHAFATIDVSMISNEVFENETITIYGVYAGLAENVNGSKDPIFIATEIY